MLCSSLGVQVFPMVVMATPVMVIKTATTFVIFIESWPRRAPNKSVKSPDVAVRTVVLATLVFASAEFDKYCMTSKHEIMKRKKILETNDEDRHMSK